MRGKVPSTENKLEIVKNSIDKELRNKEICSNYDASNRYKPKEMLEILFCLDKKLKLNDDRFIKNSFSYEFIDGTRIDKLDNTIKPQKYYGLLWGRLGLRNPIGDIYNYVHIMPYTVTVNDDGLGVQDNKNMCKMCCYSALRGNHIYRDMEENYYPDLDVKTGNTHLWQADSIQFVLVTNMSTEIKKDANEKTGKFKLSDNLEMKKKSTQCGPGILIDKKGRESINRFCYSKSTNYNLAESKFIDNGSEALNKKDSAEVLVDLLNEFITDKEREFNSINNKNGGN